MSATATRTALEALGDRVAGITFATLPAEVVARTKANTAMNLAVGLAHGEAGAGAAALATGSGPAKATLLATGERAATEQAAFANAVLIHGTGQDDTHYPSQTHPGAVVLPTALALGEHASVGGEAFIAALVAGYEVTAAVGELLVADVLARGFRPTMLFGTLGAAAAAAAILNLPARACASALGLSTSFAGGLSQTWLDGSSEWRHQVGVAARNGIVAAQLAGSGEAGALRALEGDAGFANGFGGPEARDAARGWEPDERWRTLDVIYKPYPVCNINQAPIALAVELARRHGLAPARVKTVRCFLNPDDSVYPGTAERAPFASGSAAGMSAAFCVAAALVERDVERATLERFADPAVVELSRRVQVNADDQLRPLEARLELETTDGEFRFAEQRDGGDAFRWEWPRVVAEIERLGLGHITEAVSQMETFANIHELTDGLRA